MHHFGAAVEAEDEQDLWTASALKNHQEAPRRFWGHPCGGYPTQIGHPAWGVPYPECGQYGK